MLPCELCRSLVCSIAALGMFKPITIIDSSHWPYLHAARDHTLNRLDILYVCTYTMTEQFVKWAWWSYIYSK